MSSESRVSSGKRVAVAALCRCPQPALRVRAPGRGGGGVSAAAAAAPGFWRPVSAPGCKAGSWQLGRAVTRLL